MNDRPPSPSVIVVTGGNGFIGSHVARHLFDLGHHVRVVDIAPTSKHDDIPFYTERLIGDICNPYFCKLALRGAKTVLHFAAIMGGTGVIHADNNDIVYHANHTMTRNMLAAACQSGVQTFFYASLACVYPVSLQQGMGSRDASLRESDVYGQSGPQPQHLYGLEKLTLEQLALQYSDRMNISIGRFHNVYGPRGSWDDGHEKVPAAFIRKALASKRLIDHGEQPKFKIWGDGSQKQSFLYIDDAVRAVALLIALLPNTREGPLPLNIGSDTPLTIRELAELSLSIVGLKPSDVEFIPTERPVGVASRNSNNELVDRLLAWSPQVPYQDGLGRTMRWIEGQMDSGMPSSHEGRLTYLHSLMSSGVVYSAKTEIHYEGPRAPTCPP